MAVVVDEIMNREVFSARPNESASDARGYISALGISASPVVDDDGELVGMISLRDLIADRGGDRVRDRMSTPVVTVRSGSTIRRAAELIGESGFHRLVVVDFDGRPIGILSSLDVVRGLIGLPATHPPVFPHLDRETGVEWSDDTVLELDRVDVAPDGPGVLVLVYGGAGRRERVVWAEECLNVRARLIDILSRPRERAPIVQHWLERGDLRFRTAVIFDRDRRQAVVSTVRGQVAP